MENVDKGCSEARCTGLSPCAAYFSVLAGCGMARRVPLTAIESRAIDAGGGEDGAGATSILAT
jgi:hypothetical protein